MVDPGMMSGVDPAWLHSVVTGESRNVDASSFIACPFLLAPSIY